MDSPKTDQEAEQKTEHEIAPPKQVSRFELFTGFLMVGLFGFGGIAAAIYHIVVERKQWLTARDYAAVLGLGQVLPGANLVNITAVIGDRFGGLWGAVLALLGLTLAPVLILVALATLYDQFATNPDVIAGTKAAAAGAAGLIFGTGYKLGKTILDNRWSLFFATLSFVSIGLLRWPLLGTLAVLAPIAVAFSFWRGRHEG